MPVEEGKVKVQMVKNTRYGIKSEKGVKSVSLEIGTIVLCSKVVAKELTDNGVAVYYRPEKAKEIEI